MVIATSGHKNRAKAMDLEEVCSAQECRQIWRRRMLSDAVESIFMESNAMSADNAVVWVEDTSQTKAYYIACYTHLV